jgi:glycosyltransferase involved in cell wall biosynthesis
MKILHVVHQYLPDSIGGTEHYTRQLATTQAAVGHDVGIFYPRQHQADMKVETTEDVRVYAAGGDDRNRTDVFTAMFGSPQLQAQFDRAFDEFQPQVLHIQHLMGLPLSIVDRAKRAGVRCVFTLHDYWSLCGNAQLLTNYDQTVCNGPRWWLNCARCAVARIGQPPLLIGAPAIAALFGWRAQLIKRVLHQMDALLSPSLLVKRMTIRAGAKADRVHHLPYGIDRSGVRPHHDRSDQEFRVAYIGSLAWQKGVHVLVEAFNQVPAPATLTIYGDPDVFPEYSQQLRTLAQSPRIRFAGKLSRADLWPTLAETDLVAVPSIWYENQPVTILEAFSADVPVLASDLGALPELVIDNRSGWRAKAGDVKAWVQALTEIAGGQKRIEHVDAQVSDVLIDHLPKVMEFYK